MDIKELRDKVDEISASEHKITRSRQRIKRSPLAKALLAKGENLKEFEFLRENILKEAYPQTKIENILCEKIITTLWEAERAAEVEKNMFNEQNEITENEQLGINDFLGPQPRKRIRNIKRVRLHTQEIQQVINYRLELEKLALKLFERLRQEQGLKKQKRRSKS
jgi:hypothetical protein